MKKTIFFVLTLFCLSSAFANPIKDTGKITGKIIDANAKPLAYANVILMATADSALVKAEFTQENGAFEILNVPAGNYWLSITYVGLPDFATQPFSVKTGETVNLPDIVMKGGGVELAEVTVTGKKPLVEVHADKTVFNVEGSINASGSDGLELLRKAPGVVVDNNDNIMLLGKNGVKVYMDGKPTHLSAEDLANYLKTIQSSDIANIEIITNPSSRYDAEGNAGIINIRMKKDKKLGANGSANLGYSVGRKQSYNGGLRGNYRNKKMNTFGSYNYSNGAWEEKLNLYREQFGTTFDQRGENGGEHRSHNFKLGNDFFLNDKNTLGFIVNGYASDHVWKNEGRTAIYETGNTAPDETLIASGNTEGTRQNFNFNANYRFDDAKGTIWNLDADYGFFNNEDEQTQPNEYRTGDGGEGSQLLRFKEYLSIAPTSIDIGTFKLDHERPFAKGNLSAGVKFSYVKTDNDFNFYNVLEGKPELDVERTNFFEYVENVNAAYLNFSRQLNPKFSFQAGLRAEQTNSEGDLTDLTGIENDSNHVKREYFNLFPSGGVTWNANETNSFSLTYSRRLDRPSYQDLNPFEERLDELTFQKGNPFLNPQYSHNLQLNHTFKFMYNTSLAYSHTTDLFSRIVESDDRDSSASFIGYKNLASQKNLSLTLSAPIQIAKWWSAFANLSGYRVHNKADFGEGKVVDVTVYAFNVYAQQTFNLPHDFAIEMSGWYNSPAVFEGNLESEEMWSVDAGVQKKLLKGKANLKLSVSDIFHTQNWRGSSRLGELYLRGRGDNDSTRFRANLTYNFGNEQVKGERRRSTGLEDEKNRIKSGN